ncbi:hypothetical protein MRB53_012600 [Persea americana]|uniref:Uncharacterized protein n=1 Tax=Persea americana TaxID=3435 RepID=A0ACC2LY80_PERAE|nr:hypothetical protein MRB53_012600 [Persea americana]
MERLLEQYSKESMKLAMLKHEEIFKEQVNELHRLYQIQKLLMDEMESKGLMKPPTSLQPYECDFERQNTEEDTSLSLANHSYKDQKGPLLAIDLERPAEDYISDDCGESILQIQQESDIELTLGRGYIQRNKYETSLASDSGRSFSSSSSDSSAMQKYVPTPSMKTREMLTNLDWGPFQMPPTNLSFQSEKKSFFIADEHLRQERVNQPPWLFHVLS